MRKRKMLGSAGAALLIAAAASAALLAGCGMVSRPKPETAAAAETKAAGTMAEETTAAGTEKAETPGAAQAESTAAEDASGAQDASGASETETETAVLPVGIESCGWDARRYDPAIRAEEYPPAAYVDVEELFAAPETVERYPELGKAFEAMNEKNRSAYLPELPDLAESCAEADEPGNEKLDLYVRRADSGAVSLQVAATGYTGGVHGYEVYGAKNLDPATGKEIPLTDVIKDVEGLKQVLSDQLEEKYSGGTDGYFMLFDDYRSTISQLETENFVFTVEQDGLTFWFSPYDIGPYASGRLDTKLRYAEHPELFTGKYANASESYTQEFEWIYPFEFTRADGTPASLSIYVSQDEYGNYIDLTIEVDGKYRFSEDDYFFSLDPVFVHSAEKGNFLYITTSSDNDYTFIKVFDLNGPAPVKVGELSGMSEASRCVTPPNQEIGIKTVPDKEGSRGAYTEIYESSWHRILITDPDLFVLEKRLDDLSTTSGIQNFRVGEDGMPEGLDGRYDIINDFVLTALQDFNARESDAETFREGAKTKIPAGTRLKIRYAEGLEESSRVWLEREDGSLIVVTVTREDWEQKVDGMRIMDLFEGMMFAG